MSQQTIKQQARRAALEAQAAFRKERVAREKRLADLASEVLVAVGERDAAIRHAEQCAGEALAEMTDSAGLTIAEAVAWCGGQITVREATRLRRLTRAGDREG